MRYEKEARRARTLLRLAGPLVATHLLEYLPSVTSTILVGHLPSKRALDATMLAVMCFNITAVDIGLGLAMALDVLVPNAVGRKDDRALAHAVHKAILVLAVALVPIVLLNVFAGDILLAIGQPPDVARMAGEYTRIAVSGAPCLLLYELLKKVLQAKQIVRPVTAVAVAANGIHAGLAYYLVLHTELGFLGAALSRTVTNVCMALMVLAYTAYEPAAHSWWRPFSRESFRGMRSFVGLALTTMILLALEMWAFEIITFMAGRLADAETALGVQAIIFDITTITFTFYLGTQIAGNVLIGTAVGRGAAADAKSYSTLTVALSLVQGAVFAVLLHVLRDTIPAWFTVDKDIRLACAPLLTILAVYQLADSFNQACAAIFKSAGRTREATVITFVAYVVVGLPVGGVLAHNADMGLAGIWWGICIGLGVASLLSMLVLARLVRFPTKDPLATKLLPTQRKAEQENV